MRNMSFYHTTEQIRNRSKTVTRRLGWAFLKPGDRVRAVVKGRGLKKGQKVEPLAVLEVVSNTPVLLMDMDRKDLAREGFPDQTVPEFVMFFCKSMKVDPDQVVNRIEFRYIEEADHAH